MQKEFKAVIIFAVLALIPPACLELRGKRSLFPLILSGEEFKFELLGGRELSSIEIWIYECISSNLAWGISQEINQ